MNYNGYADYSDKPIFSGKGINYGYEGQPFGDQGQGIPQMNANNMTIEDVYRTGFLLSSDNRKDFKNLAPTALKGISSGESELSKLFFSDENIKRIQRMIKAEVFRRTKGVFRIDVDQESREIFLLCRSIYMQQARFLPGETVRQVKRLNEKVVSECVPDMISAIRQEYGYLKEINSPLNPIPRPICASSRGHRVLPSVCTTFGA